MKDRLREIIKRFHPEGIPWPGSVLYNALSRTAIFRRHYELAAQDILCYGRSAHILDIGTGPGHLLLAIQKAVSDTKLVGIDVSPAMVEQAHRNMKTRGQSSQIKLQVARANALPFADETFDRVVSTGSLHHWKDPVSALAEVHRVLKNDGYALMYDLVRDMPKEICERIRAQFGSLYLALLVLHSLEEPFLDAKEMDALGRQTAFVVEGTRFTGALCCLVLKKPAA